jgi:hypothetical protein
MPPLFSKANLSACRRLVFVFVTAAVTITTLRIAGLYGFLLGGEDHATCLMRSAELVERVA